MSIRAPERVFALIAALAAAAILPGCLIHTHSRVTYLSDTRPVSDHVIRQLHIGSTTRQWVLENLGPPTSVQQIDERTEILQYVTSRKKDDRLSLFIIGSFEGSVETHEMFFIRLEDELVTDFGRRRL